MIRKTYEKPSVTIIKVQVEKGFAGSGDTYSNKGEAGILSEGETYTWD